MTRPIAQIGLAVKRLQHRHQKAIDAALAGHGISLVQWDALRHISENPGASLHDLAQLTFQSDQGFGTLANRMVERGFIERLSGPGRAVRHQLTERGELVRADAQKVVDGVLTNSFAPLDADELKAFDALLRKLV
jgi:DNA-binding MarR family transcriptional regulator